MNNTEIAILSLLSREPLSGYDMKLQANSRFGPFWKVNNNQLYPAIAALEHKGWINLTLRVQESHHPEKKIFSITPQGTQALTSWVLEPTAVEGVRDEFVLKIYNSWLIDPAKVEALLDDQKRQHQEQLEALNEKLRSLAGNPTEQIRPGTPLSATMAVVKMGIAYEAAYLGWCEIVMSHLISGSVDSQPTEE